MDPNKNNMIISSSADDYIPPQPSYEATPVRPKKKLIIIIIAAVVVIGAVVAILLFTSRGEESARPTPIDPAQREAGLQLLSEIGDYKTKLNHLESIAYGAQSNELTLGDVLVGTTIDDALTEINTFSDIESAIAEIESSTLPASAKSDFDNVKSRLAKEKDYYTNTFKLLKAIKIANTNQAPIDTSQLQSATGLSEFVDGYNMALADGSFIKYFRQESYAKQVFSIYGTISLEPPTLASSLRQLISTLESLDEN